MTSVPRKRTLLASAGSWGVSGGREQDVVPKWASVHTHSLGFVSDWGRNNESSRCRGGQSALLLVYGEAEANMAEPQAASALGGQDEVGQLTQPFFLFISPQDCALRTRSPGCRKRSRSPRFCLHCGQMCSSCSFPPAPAPATQTGRGCGAGTEAGPLNTLLVKGIEVGMGERKRPGQ